ncbi:MAG: hypothetical protein H0V82_05240 [Candidatus Protochlamydia sp.]|nr:hypothetical protein [Candidatus Protochlamydia sp.]
MYINNVISNSFLPSIESKNHLQKKINEVKDIEALDFINFIDCYFNLRGNISTCPPIAETVGWQVLHASQAFIDCSESVQLAKFNFDHLSIKDLVSLFQVLNSYAINHTTSLAALIQKFHLSAIETYILQICVKEPLKGWEIHDALVKLNNSDVHPLIDIIKNKCYEGPSLTNLVNIDVIHRIIIPKLPLSSLLSFTATCKKFKDFKDDKALFIDKLNFLKIKHSNILNHSLFCKVLDKLIENKEEIMIEDCFSFDRLVTNENYNIVADHQSWGMSQLKKLNRINFKSILIIKNMTYYEEKLQPATMYPGTTFGNVKEISTFGIIVKVVEEDNVDNSAPLTGYVIIAPYQDTTINPFSERISNELMCLKLVPDQNDLSQVILSHNFDWINYL